MTSRSFWLNFENAFAAYVSTTSRLQSLTYPNGQVSTYAYLPNSSDRRLQEIHHKTSTSGTTLSRFSYAYDAIGNIRTWTQQYATTTNAYDLGYDPADQVTAATLHTTEPTPSILKRYAYGYDPVGNRTTEQLDDSPTAFTYNNVNRLTSQDGGGALSFRGMVSEAATVTVQAKPSSVGATNSFEGKAQVTPGANTVAVVATDPSGNTRTNTYQISVTGGPRSFGYDANGSQTSNGTKTYEWDGQNRLIRVRENGNEVARFGYDGFGRRAQKVSGGVTRTYVYDGEDILEERLSTGATIRYIHGTGVDRPMAAIDGLGAVSYYLADHLGSIVQVTDSAGQVTLMRQYDPYGNPLAGGLASGYAFTGREWDAEIQLYYYRARYYDPVPARFISEDPHSLGTVRLPRMPDPQAWKVLTQDTGANLYVYVGSNPLSFADPQGLSRSKPMPPKLPDPPSPGPCAMGFVRIRYEECGAWLLNTNPDCTIEIIYLPSFDCPPSPCPTPSPGSPGQPQNT